MPRFYQFSADGQLQCSVRISDAQLMASGMPLTTAGGYRVRYDAGLPKTAVYLNVEQQMVYHYRLQSTGMWDQDGEPIMQRVLDNATPPIAVVAEASHAV